MFNKSSRCFVVALILFGASMSCRSKDVPSSKVTESKAESAVSRSEQGISLFKQYLASNYSGRTWLHGPSQIDSEELQYSYPGCRFYFVSSPHPMPGGALKKVNPDQPQAPVALPQLSLSIRISPDGKLTELAKPEDYNSGMQIVRSDEDARKVGAAILSTLDGFYFGPAIVSRSNVLAVASPEGWICRLNSRTKAGKVVFDKDGRCRAASLEYRGQFPP